MNPKHPHGPPTTTGKCARTAMKSLNDEARAERVVATLTRLGNVFNVGTIERELELARRR